MSPQTPDEPPPGTDIAELLDNAEDIINSIMNAPMVRCDEIQWSWLGISMAGWNAILSFAAALSILWLSLKRPRTR